MFSNFIKHAFSTAMHGARCAEKSLFNLLVCMEFAGLWLQILKPIIQIAATVTGRASVSRTRERSISEIHNKMCPPYAVDFHSEIKSVSLGWSFKICHIWDDSKPRCWSGINEGLPYLLLPGITVQPFLGAVFMFKDVECDAKLNWASITYKQ